MRTSGKWAALAVPAAGLVALGLWAQSLLPEVALKSSPPPEIKPLSGPWVVAVQAGHWRIGELPDELARLRGDTGAVYGSVREVDINKAVADALLPKLRAEGWTAIFVPATVPAGLRADAFVAIHADGASDSSRRGWKLSAPWRASPASRSLARALESSFAAEPGLVEDSGGVTVNMRGYYAFNYRRFDHAISPYTPSCIIELGFISNAEDRERLTGDPDFWADIIVRGLKSYFAGRSRSETEDLRPLVLPWVAAGPRGIAVRSEPADSGNVLWSLPAGTVVLPVDVSGGWYEVFVRERFATGWVPIADVVETSDPHWLMPGERGYRPPGG